MSTPTTPASNPSTVEVAPASNGGAANPATSTSSAAWVQPTQLRRPWRTALRTVVQVGIPAVLGLGVVVPQVVQIILDEAGESMPPNLTAILLATSGVVTAAAAILSRIMALPGVEALLRKVLPFLAAAPSPAREQRAEERKALRARR